MSFLNPWMLLGGLAAGIPIALHFLYRARYKPIPWGAMKFLRLAVEQTSRRLKFQELILLIIRTLALLLLALALSRLTTCVGTKGTGPRGEAVDAIFIIDTSYSMNAKEGVQTRLDVAKEAAIKVINGLPAGSTVQIITCSDRATTVGPRSPSNLDQAKLIINGLKATQQATDYLPGLIEAVNAFERTTGNQKEVYLFSDMGRNGWESQSSAIRDKCTEIKNQATLYLVRCANQPIYNVSIIDLKPQTVIPHTGERVPFTVLVKNTSTETVKNLTLSLEVDGKTNEKEDQPIEKIAPGEIRAINLTAKIEEAGWRILTAKLNTDDLPDDNRFSKVLLIRKKVRVLMIDGAPDERDPERSAAFFLGHAILPVPERPAELREKYHVRLSVLRTREVSPSSLNEQDVCILANVPLTGPNALSPEVVRRLTEFVKGGGGLFITGGPNLEPKSYNRGLGSEGEKLLPSDIVDFAIRPENDPVYPDLSSAEPFSFLGKFAEKGSRLNMLKNTDILTYVRVQEPEAGTAQVLMRYTDGSPFILSRRHGDGEILFLTARADRWDWGYLATNPTFIPLVQGVLTQLVERSSSGYNLIAGQTLRYLPNDTNKSYVLTTPPKDSRSPEEKIKLGKPIPVVGSDRNGLIVNETSTAGIYIITPEGEKDGQPFAVNPDPREIEGMDPLTDEVINDLIGFKAIYFGASEESDAITSNTRSKNERTVWILSLVLIFIFGESLWAWYCSKAW
ncbi:MAG: VWA domain-containing protein [Gemmataceae bacterium]|jgi:hypothetical protein|nr:VWA domain-containing protein [Gemmataceae bacterium]